MNKILILTCFIFFPLVLYTDGNWNLIKNSGGIEIHNRDVAGSDIKEFRAVAVLDSSIDTIFEVMTDVQAAPQWMDNCKETRVIKYIDNFKIVKKKFHARIRIYHVISAPFPVSNRDFIIETEIKGDLSTGTININFQAVTDPGVPYREGHVRIIELKGSWYFRYVDPNHTMAVYQVKQNPGGKLPSYLVNYVNRDIPYKTMTGLKKISKTGKYIKLAEKNSLFARER